MTTPRIFIVGEGLTDPPRAGYHIHLLSLANALAKLTEVRAFAYMDEGGSDVPHLVRVARPSGTTSAWRRKMNYWAHVRDYLAREAEGGDVVWVRGLPTALTLAPALLGWDPRLRGLRFVYDASSILELEASLRDGSRSLGIMGAMEKWIRRRFHLVRTLGKAMRETLIESGVSAGRILVAPVGAMVPAGEVRRRERVRKILYLGSMSPWQGFPTLLQAMDELREQRPDIRLTIVGLKPEQFSVLSERPNIDPVGWVDRAALPRLYTEHDLFVVPRPSTELTRRVIPMKVVEAQAHGIPILASDLPAIREVTGGKSARLVVPNSVESLRDGILELAEDSSALQRLTEEAIGRRRNFEWSAIARTIVEWLGEHR